MDQAQVERVRSFNRSVGEAIGALDDHFLGRDRPMGEARLLWQVGDGAEVRDIRHRLGLDPGYVSRLVRSLQRQGLVQLTVDSGDRRVRRIQPTEAGRAERAELDRRSDELAEALLDPLDADERTRLVAAMSEVERLMIRSRTTIRPVAANDPQVRRCFDRYAAELHQRFDGGFDIARSNPMDIVDLVPPRGMVLLARIGGDAVGCGALMFQPGDIAEVRRVWIAPRVRGMGLGRRMLRELEQHAHDRGARVARLETNRSLVEAVSMYRDAGYQEVPAFNHEPYADHWFEKRLGWAGPPPGVP